MSQTSEDSRLDRFRRGFERFRGDSDAYAARGTQDGEGDLELNLLLLREENARLKEERHRPPDVGTMIEQMRRIAVEPSEDELSDEIWDLLSECLVIREELDQACTEITAAVSAVQRRLGRLAITIETASHGLPNAAGLRGPSSPERETALSARAHLQALPVEELADGTR